jgi:drug/metabolite transporter (DMT)-like permease
MPANAPTRALLLLVVLTLLWGTNWPMFPMVLAELSIWTFRTIAVGLASVLLFALARWRGLSLSVPRHNWSWLLVASLTNLVIWNITSALATVYLPSGQAAVLAYTMPLWVALLSLLFLGERLTARLALALVLGAAAVLLLLWPNIGQATNAPLGAALGLIAGFAWAIGTLIVKRVTWGAPGLTVTAWQVMLCWFPITLGTAFFSDWSFTPPSTMTLALVVYIALVPMAIGTACWFAIVKLLPTNVAALSSIAVPVVAMLSGALVNREPLGPLQAGALACAVAAIWLVLRQTPARRADHVLPLKGVGQNGEADLPSGGAGSAGRGRSHEVIRRRADS